MLHSRRQKTRTQLLRHYQRILCKVAVDLTVFVVRGTGPASFKDVCVPVADISGRAHLRSAERCDMLVPRTRTRFSQRSFHVAAPVVWNSLPTHLRSTSVSREQFRDVQRWVEDPSLHTGLPLPLRTFCLRAYTTLTLTRTIPVCNSTCTENKANLPLSFDVQELKCFQLQRDSLRLSLNTAGAPPVDTRCKLVLRARHEVTTAIAAPLHLFHF